MIILRNAQQIPFPRLYFRNRLFQFQPPLFRTPCQLFLKILSCLPPPTGCCQQHQHQTHASSKLFFRKFRQYQSAEDRYHVVKRHIRRTHVSCKRQQFPIILHGKHIHTCDAQNICTIQGKSSQQEHSVAFLFLPGTKPYQRAQNHNP